MDVFTLQVKYYPQDLHQIGWKSRFAAHILNPAAFKNKTNVKARFNPNLQERVSRSFKEYFQATVAQFWNIRLNIFERSDIKVNFSGTSLTEVSNKPLGLRH